VYLTSDALIYHGWIAYTYPTLAFFTFTAIACLWMSARPPVAGSSRGSPPRRSPAAR
jgi:hypothetical protein